MSSKRTKRVVDNLLDMLVVVSRDTAIFDKMCEIIDDEYKDLSIAVVRLEVEADNARLRIAGLLQDKRILQHRQPQVDTFDGNEVRTDGGET